MNFDSDSEAYEPVEHLCVLAPGLLGASVAMACQQNRTAKKTTIWSRRANSRAKLVDQPWCDRVCETPSEAASGADLVVICAPVDFIVPLFNDIKDSLKKGAIVTDVGSTKSLICRQANAYAESDAYFIGSHPMAGSEKTGMEHADAELFVNRPCIVTPTENVPDSAVRRVIRFWKALGALTFVETPEAHDEIVAHISHLPHLLASLLCNVVEQQNKNWEQLAGTGFKDATRIAAGDPSLWKAIIETNKEEIIRAISKYQDELHRVQSALTNNNMVQIVSVLEQGKQFRDRLV